MANQWDQWRNGGKPLTDPDAFDAEGKPKHAYCTWCGKVTSGPHTGQRWPKTPEGKPIIQAADDERTYTAEEAEAAGKSHNVSGSICPECYDATLKQWRAEREERLRQQQANETA